MFSSIFEPPVWGGVLIAVATFACLLVGALAAILHGARRLDRRVARELRPETARAWERDAASSCRPHGGVEPECFALDRAERRDRFARPRLELVVSYELQRRRGPRS